VLVLVVAGGCDDSDESGSGVASSARPTTSAATAATGSSDATDPPGALAEMPEPRTEVAGAAWDGRIVVVGGLTADGAASDRADLYDPATNAWTPLPDLPRGVHHAAVVEFAGRAWVVGGYTAFEGDLFVPLRTVFSLGDGDDAWRAEPQLVQIRGALAAAVIDGAIVAAGGTDGSAVLTSTEVLRDGSDAWEPGRPLGEAREHFALTAHRGTLYAIAGREGGADQNKTSVETAAGAGESWTPGAPIAHARSGIGAASVSGRVCVAGGETPDSTVAPVECTLGNRGWEVVAQLATPRHGLVVVALGSRLHVIGGGPEPGLTVSGDHEVFEVP